MKLLHNIGKRHNSNYNTLEEVLACREPLSFDGVYRNVYDNYKALKGKDVTFFVMGDYVGEKNSFDRGQLPEKYCTWDQIKEMVEFLDARLGWHSWSHRMMTKLSDNEVLKEITPPHFLPVTTFAYPHGVFDKRIEQIIIESGLYEDAWTVHQGNNTRFQKRRSYLNW